MHFHLRYRHFPSICHRATMWACLRDPGSLHEGVKP